ncbi:MAG: potassium-transporting ATPase subunit KdpC [Chitinivibrionales bacterium]|nr:potassium-transporting ATPase subunit KdpC [Chitinivibrionales bacterium]
MKSLLRAFLILLALTIVTGLLYPLATTLAAVVCFPRQAHGSLAYSKGRLIGSRLIGQNFSDRRYFWPRPSATNYSAMPSGGSNLISLSDTLRAQVNARRAAFRSANGLTERDTVPNDMLFTSGSGLDPHISPAAARLQIERIARERAFTDAKKTALAALVERSILKPQLGFLGEPRINVFYLNQALDLLNQAQ